MAYGQSIQQPITTHVSTIHPVMANVRTPAEHMLTLIANIILLRPGSERYSRTFCERWINNDRSDDVVEFLSQRSFTPAEWQHCVNMIGTISQSAPSTNYRALTDGNDAEYEILPVT